MIFCIATLGGRLHFWVKRARGYYYGIALRVTYGKIHDSTPYGSEIQPVIILELSTVGLITPSPTTSVSDIRSSYAGYYLYSGV